MERNDAYGQFPEADTRGTYRLTPDYISIATHAAAVQVRKGGVRPADILNKVLGRHVNVEAGPSFRVGF